MIGIPELDRLSTREMYQIVMGRIKIVVRDPKKIQHHVFQEQTRPQIIQETMMSDAKVKVLLDMEIESRLGWAYVAEQIDASANR